MTQRTRTRPRKKPKGESASRRLPAPRLDDHEHRRFSREVRTVFRVLGAVVLLAAVAALELRDIWWVDTFAAGLATETTGILITLVFVHQFLERQERQRRLRGSIGALRRGSRALRAMAEAWGRLITGSLARHPADAPKTLLDLFVPHVAENMIYADPDRRPLDDHDSEDKAWVRILTEQVLAARDVLNEIIVSYNASLDPAYVETIDEIVDDDFPRIVQSLAEAEPSVREWRLRMNGARAARETHLLRLSRAIDLHNRLAHEASTVRTRRIAPRTGAVGMELPLEHDLLVDLELGRHWWIGPPSTGELRAQA